MEIAKLLLAHEAIVNAPGPDGTTPLMMAGLSGSRDMADLLLKAGADPTMRNLQGLDAAAWAASAKHQDLATELTQAAVKHEAQLQGAATDGATSDGATSPMPAAAPDTAPPAGAADPGSLYVAPPANSPPGSPRPGAAQVERGGKACSSIRMPGQGRADLTGTARENPIRMIFC